VTETPETPAVDPTEPHAAIRTVRGDMPEWSDHRVERPAPGGPALRHVVSQVLDAALGAAVGTGHTLVLGPLDDELLDLVVDASGRTTVLVRGHVDAMRAAQRYPGGTVEIVCGDLAALAATDADLVLALDGVGRLTSINVEERSWRENLDLVAATAPGAALAIAIENPLAFARLAGAVAATSDDDSAWWPYDALDATAPTTIDEARSVFASDGAVEVWTVRPDLRRPTLLSRSGVAVPPALEVGAQPRGLGRSDVRGAVAELAARDRTDAIAAGWLALRGAAVSGDAVVVRGGSAASLEAAALPAGELMESLLVDACVRRDQARIHDLVRAWAATIGRVPAGAAAATADNVIVSPTGNLSVLDAHLLVADSVGPDPVGHHFADFANRLSDLGVRHPWPVAAGSAEITAYLLAIIGRTVDPGEAADVVAAARRTASSLPFAQAMPAELARERAENDALRSKVRWFEDALRQRETQIAQLRTERDDPRPRLQRRIRDLEEELATLRASTSFRAGRMLTAPARRLRAARNG
jgi:hypothetical protein